MELESLSNKELEDIYVECLLKEKVTIESKNLNHKIDDYINDYLKKKIENKCINEGFVKEDSIKIVNKSVGYIKNSRFYGEVSYDILFKAIICNPVVGNIIDCKVKFVNKLGLLGNNGPLVIIVGRQFHKNDEILNEINVDDIVKVEVIAKKYSINDKEIKVIAKLKTDEDNDYDDKKDLTLGDIQQIDDDDDDDFADKSENMFEETLQEKENDDDDDDDMLDDLDDDDFDDELEYDDEVDKELMINGVQDEINDDDIPDDEETLDEDEDDF